jgi:transglutaminase-like putative cysteine protease
MSSSKSKLPEGWTTLFLLAGMVMSATWSITSSKWVDDIQVIETAVVYGLLVGLLLAKSRFPALLSHLFSLVYGAALVSYLGTRLVPAAFGLRERLLELGYHINSWLWGVLHGGQSGDQLMFILFLACVVWLMGYAAAWATFRTYRIWWAILPSATVLLINFYWGPPRLLPFLIAYVAFMLLFIIRFNLFRYQQAWAEARVRYDSEIVWDFLRYGLVFTVVVMALAWGAPGAAASEQVADFWGRFSEPWERVQDTWNRLFFSSRYYGQPQPSAFGGVLTLGGAVRLGNRVVMDVAAPAGRYWRGAVYDEYTGSGWVNTDQEMAYLDSFDPDFVVPSFEMRRLITQTYVSYLPGRTELLAAAEPVAVDRLVKVRNSQVMDRLPGEIHTTEMLNVSILYARSQLEGGEAYRIVSSLTAADEESLRNAGTDYPDWVTARYLQLPDSVPQRVHDLAKGITHWETNPYDQAVALQDYLRGIEYDQMIPNPPLNQDRVDWFLFDLQKGYCDYYASSMVVMARTLGIPARVAVGYGRGEYNSEVGAYRVRDNNAHSWVEVFFPRYGWVEFEPTASEPVIVRPRPPSENTGGEGGSEGPLNQYDDMDRWRDNLYDDYYPGSLNLPESNPYLRAIWWGLGGLLAVAVVVGGGYWWLEERGLRGLGWVQKAYARMTRFGRLLRVPERDPQTPFEYAAELSAEVPAGRVLIHRIAGLFVEDRFSSHAVDEAQSATAWRDLRPSLLQRWFRRWVERFQTPPEEEHSAS